MIKRILPLLLVALLLAGCASGTNTAKTAAPAETAAPEAEETAAPEDAAAEEPAETETEETAAEAEPTGGNPIVTIQMKDLGTITVELYPDVAPNTVANFVTLVQSGFYDGLTFHRVIPGFMIQGGDPLGTGMGNPGYSIKGEFTANGFQNDLKHTRGVISMARSQLPDSAGSQFFIMHADYPSLNGQYASFGKVTDGMDVVYAIASVKTGANDKPVEDVVIEKMTVETFGVEYTVEKIQ